MAKKKQWRVHTPTTNKKVEKACRFIARCMYYIARLYKIEYISMFTFWKDGCTDITAKNGDEYIINEAWV